MNKLLLTLTFVFGAFLVKASDTTYLTKDYQVFITTNIEIYKTRVLNIESFDKLYIYQRKDRYGSKTGCQSQETLLSQWLEVYDLIK
jgi:hypothetical protein